MAKIQKILLVIINILPNYYANYSSRLYLYLQFNFISFPMGSLLNSGLAKTILLAFLLTDTLAAVLSAQTEVTGKRKIYESWINLEHSTEKIRGVLFETRDSSLIISESRISLDYPPKQFQGKEYNYSQLKNLQIRRLNNVPRGAIIGGITGFSIVFIGTSMLGEVPLWASFLAGIPAAGSGAGIGALAGSVKIRIPLYGNYEAFNVNRDKLNYFSYLENPTYSRHEHDNYFAFLVGPSIPQGELRSINPDSGSISIHNGYNSEFALFVKLAPDVGVKLFFFDNQYEAGLSSSGYWLVWSGLAIGPAFSFPVTRKIFFDVEPGISVGDLSLMKAETEILHGRGLTLITCATARFNIASRWCLLAGTNYSLGKLRMNNSTRISAQAINLRFGAGYRFR
jgi:hypothetical protein